MIEWQKDRLIGFIIGTAFTFAILTLAKALLTG